MTVDFRFFKEMDKHPELGTSTVPSSGGRVLSKR